MSTQFTQEADWIKTLRTSTVPYFAVTLADGADSHAVDDRVRWIQRRHDLCRGLHRAGAGVPRRSVAWCQTSAVSPAGICTTARAGAELQGFVSVGDPQETAEIIQVIATAAPFRRFNMEVIEPGGHPVEGSNPSARLIPSFLEQEARAPYGFRLGTVAMGGAAWINQVSD